MKRRGVVAAALIMLTSGHAAPARATTDQAAFELVKDIATTAIPNSGFSGGILADLGSFALFGAYTDRTGFELWRSDGSEAGTTLVKDIAPGEDSGFSSIGTRSIVFSDTLLFGADDGALGLELWRSDGTPDGTQLLKDLRPGALSGHPGNFRSSQDGRVFFTAAVTNTRTALWISDGTPQGTQMLRSFRHIPSQFAYVNGALLFAAAENDTGSDTELWRSDGTPAGTTQIQDIYPGELGSFPREFFSINSGLLVFAANHPMHGFELWRTDGTPGGTALIEDIRPGAEGSTMSGFVVLVGLPVIGGPTINRVVFSANDGQNGKELWVTDGTAAGTQLIADTRPGTAGSDPFLLGNAPKSSLLLSNRALYAMDDGTHGRELWITNGTPAGTFLLTDTVAGSGSSTFSSAVLSGGLSYFSASGSGTGTELWKTNGTPTGTLMIKDIVTGTGSSSPGSLHIFNGALYFVASDGVHGRELWRSDGTPSGTSMLKDINPSAGEHDTSVHIAGAALGTLFLGANDGVAGDELWKTDGTPAGTVPVKNIAADTGNLDVNPDENATALGDQLIVGAFISKPNPAPPDVALWRSDGTSAGTSPIKSFAIPYGSGGSHFQSMLAISGSVLFNGFDNIAVTELWRSDGTTVGTTMPKPVVKPYFGTVYQLHRLNDIAVIKVYTGTQPSQSFDFTSLWRSDGTAQGTELVAAGLSMDHAAASGDTLFFSGSTIPSAEGAELWKTDGTAAGTMQIKDIYPGANSSEPGLLTPAQPGSIFFTAWVSDGQQLWKSDGSEAGTVLVKDIVVKPNFYDIDSTNMVYVSGKLFFEADDGVNGRELWTSDGTPGGTSMLADLFAGPGDSVPQDFVVMDGVVYFSATGSDGRRTLWRSDGSAAGTRPVRDDASAPSMPTAMKPVDGQLYFSAADTANGRELWVSDGSAAGTVLAQDIAAGPASSNPQSVLATGSHIFLSADTDGIGRELWSRPRGAGPLLGHNVFLPMAIR